MHETKDDRTGRLPVRAGEAPPGAMKKSLPGRSLKRSPHPVGPAPPARVLLLRPIAWVLASLLVVVVLGTVGRGFFDSLFTRIDRNKPVHQDSSEINAARTEVPPEVVISYRNEDGRLVRAVADAERFSAFTRKHMDRLLRAQEALAGKVGPRLAEAVAPVFADMDQGVTAFANWYFAWSTTYRLLGVALGSASSHLFSVEAMGLQDAVAADIERTIRKHYEELVLRPEINDPRLKRAYQEVLQALHRAYLGELGHFDAAFQTFVAKQTHHLDESEPSRAAGLQLDWGSHFHKLSWAKYERGGVEAVRGAGLAVAGGMAGKAVAVPLGKAGAAIASKTLVAKLSAPFAAKAVSAGAAATAGAGTGTFAGPLGTLLGVGVGLGVDYMINEGVELSTREAFEADTRTTVAVTRGEWETLMIEALRQWIRVWFEDTINLLARST